MSQNIKTIPTSEYAEVVKTVQMYVDGLVAGDVIAIEPGLWLRDVGEVRFEDLLLVTDDGSETLLTGFENHGGFTTLGPDATPLARVEVGVGNADDGTEGAVQGRVIGTYPHGPVLARNHALADHVLSVALDRELEPLDRPEIDELHRQRVDFVRKQGMRR